MGGGGRGGGGECQRIKVLRSRVFPLGQLPTITPHYRSEGPRQGSCGVFLGDF